MSVIFLQTELAITKWWLITYVRYTWGGYWNKNRKMTTIESFAHCGAVFKIIELRFILYLYVKYISSNNAILCRLTHDAVNYKTIISIIIQNCCELKNDIRQNQKDTAGWHRSAIEAQFHPIWVVCKNLSGPFSGLNSFFSELSILKGFTELQLYLGETPKNWVSFSNLSLKGTQFTHTQTKFWF